MRSHGLTQALAKAGGPSKLAKLLGVTSQAISQWETVPVARMLAIERVTGVSRRELLPELYAMPDEEAQPAPVEASQPSAVP